MQLLIFLLVLPVSLFAQQAGERGATPRPAPKNLKLLAPNTDIPFVMQSFKEALGVECAYCHVQGDFAADTNPKKEIARKMIAMVRLIDTSFPSSAGAFPDGYHEVDCSTCQDRKSTRLNSSHVAISYAVFCLKKKNIVRANE